METGEAAQLCVFILGMRYLGPGVLKCVFGFRCAVYVLVSVASQGFRTKDIFRHSMLQFANVTQRIKSFLKTVPLDCTIDKTT